MCFILSVVPLLSQPQRIETFIIDRSLAGCWHRLTVHLAAHQPRSSLNPNTPAVLGPQVWLTSQFPTETWGETGTLIALLKPDGFPFHIPRPYIIQPASSPQISVEFLVTKWKHSHLPCQQSRTFLNPSFPPPQSRTHTHALFRMGTASFHLLDGSSSAYKWKNQNSWSQVTSQ